MNLEFNSIVNKLIDISNNIIIELRNLKINNGMNGIIEITFLIQELIEYMSLQENYKQQVIEINTILSELLSAMENKDYYLVSDILEYELLEKLSNFREKQ